MKKVIYTAALLTCFAFVSNAQQAKPAQGTDVKADQPVKAGEGVNADGTKATDNAKQPNDNVKQEPAAKKGGTRMAISEKGMPASKAKKESKPVEANPPAKTDKQ